ncbi:MAG: polysaccharide biosynthesis C-terminal domain-containing protein [Bacteroidetes bacterium]|nr:polysaccharide biosynthesis C-terminal domain-containing protein [Bacteroidota bacterium]
MAYLAPVAFRLWLNDTVNVPVSVTVWMCIFAIVSNWNTMFAMFLNGTGKIRLQLYSAVLVSIINVPLSIGLLTYFGVSGVIMGTVACLGVSAVWSPIQYYKIINNTAKGIWGS